jgi:hypothetical protein
MLNRRVSLTYQVLGILLTDTGQSIGDGEALFNHYYYYLVPSKYMIMFLHQGDTDEPLFSPLSLDWFPAPVAAVVFRNHSRPYGPSPWSTEAIQANPKLHSSSSSSRLVVLCRAADTRIGQTTRGYDQPQAHHLLRVRDELLQSLELVLGRDFGVFPL